MHDFRPADAARRCLFVLLINMYEYIPNKCSKRIIDLEFAFLTQKHFLNKYQKYYFSTCLLSRGMIANYPV